MDYLRSLRDAFNILPLNFYYGREDIYYNQLEDFLKDQLHQLHDMPSLTPRAKGVPSDTWLHCHRVAEDVHSFARFIGFSEQIATNLRRAVLLHDIGKLDVPVEILDKPGKLTPEEFKEMKRHTEYGVKRIKSLNIDHPAVKLAADIAKYHHERHDGTGYYGLEGTEIPYRVRLAQLSDIFDAVSYPRAYRHNTEQMTQIDTIKNMLDPKGILYGAVDQRFAVPFCLLKVNLIQGDLSGPVFRMIENYLLNPEPFTDEDFWPSSAKITKDD